MRNKMQHKDKIAQAMRLYDPKRGDLRRQKSIPKTQPEQLTEITIRPKGLGAVDTLRQTFTIYLVREDDDSFIGVSKYNYDCKHQTLEQAGTFPKHAWEQVPETPTKVKGGRV